MIYSKLLQSRTSCYRESVLLEGLIFLGIDQVLCIMVLPGLVLLPPALSIALEALNLRRAGRGGDQNQANLAAGCARWSCEEFAWGNLPPGICPDLPDLRVWGCRSVTHPNLQMTSSRGHTPPGTSHIIDPGGHFSAGSHPEAPAAVRKLRLSPPTPFRAYSEQLSFSPVKAAMRCVPS